MTQMMLCFENAFNEFLAKENGDDTRNLRIFGWPVGIS